MYRKKRIRNRKTRRGTFRSRRQSGSIHHIMKTKILETFASYQQEDPDLAVSITARILNIEESEVRLAIA
jgi:hypothetical protein